MDLDLVTLSHRLTRREVSAVELVDACLARIENVDPLINAVREIDTPRVRAAAHESDARKDRLGPLDGVPITAKDNIDIEGLVTRSGLGPRSETTASDDADVIRRLREAGAIILGHTNMHEGALGATNDNLHTGRTHNPWRQGHTPGGSSGGSAAAVAGGLCTIALGTDTMGSIRLPACYCGLVGYKPGRRQISNDGIEPLCKSLDQVGPITRSVADLGTWCEAMAGLNPTRNEVDLRTLRIARLANVDDVDMAVDVQATFVDILTTLSQDGVDIAVRDLPGCDLGITRRDGLLVIEAEAAAHFQEDRKRYPNAFSTSFEQLLEYGAAADADRLAKAEMIIDQVEKELDAMFRKTDLLIIPTAPQTAFSFDAPVPSNQADLTALANIAGTPAVSLPIGVDQSGLPIGMQVIGAQGTDDMVIAAAATLEKMIGFELPTLPRGDWS
ncbi:MAG: amidase [Pseudomonadota bacterium]